MSACKNKLYQSDKVMIVESAKFGNEIWCKVILFILTIVNVVEKSMGIIGVVDNESTTQSITILSCWFKTWQIINTIWRIWTYSHASGTKMSPPDLVHESHIKMSSPVWWGIGWQTIVHLPSSNFVEIFHASAVSMKMWMCNRRRRIANWTKPLTTLVVFSIVSSFKRFTTLIWNLSPLYPFTTGPGNIPPANTVLGGSYD